MFQVVAGTAGFFLPDKIGRKKSLILSFSIMFVAMTGMAIYTGLVVEDDVTTETTSKSYYSSLRTSLNEAYMIFAGRVTNHNEGSFMGAHHSEERAIYPGRATAGEEDTTPYGWVPLVCLMVSQTGAVLGAMPVPYILAVEYFPTWIRPMVRDTNSFTSNCTQCVID